MTFEDFCAAGGQPSSDTVIFRFQGDLRSRSIVDLGADFRRRLEEKLVPRRIQIRVFAIFVEIVQNIINYAAGTTDRAGSIVLGQDARGYWICSTNRVDPLHARRLATRLAPMLTMTPTVAAAVHRQLLTRANAQDPDPDSRGAGLGLLAIARASSGPLSYAIVGSNSGLSEFYLGAWVAPPEETQRAA